MAPASAARIGRLNLLAAASLISLILLCVAWEMWLAPLRPGGSWLVLKSLPLLGALFGVLRGRRYTHQWACLLILLYVAEGAVRSMTDNGTTAILAAAELALALVFFVAAAFYARLTRPRPAATTALTTGD